MNLWSYRFSKNTNKKLWRFLPSLQRADPDKLSFLFWEERWLHKFILKVTDLYTSPFSIHLHRFDLKWNSILHVQKCCVYSPAYYFYFSDHQTIQLIKDKRSNSCFSESSEPGSLKNGAEQGRRPSRAFLIKQRDSGEETLVTLTPVGGRQNVPTIVGPQFSKGKDI